MPQTHQMLKTMAKVIAPDGWACVVAEWLDGSFSAEGWTNDHGETCDASPGLRECRFSSPRETMLTAFRERLNREHLRAQSSASSASHLRRGLCRPVPEGTLILKLVSPDGWTCEVARVAIGRYSPVRWQDRITGGECLQARDPSPGIQQHGFATPKEAMMVAFRERVSREELRCNAEPEDRAAPVSLTIRAERVGHRPQPSARRGHVARRS